MQTISGLGEVWEGAELTVVDSKELPKRPKVLVRIPDTSEVNRVITRLRKQNPELKTSDWLVMSRKVTETEQTLAFTIDPASHKALAKSNLKAFCGLGRIIFRTLKARQHLRHSAAQKLPLDCCRMPGCPHCTGRPQ
jgi:hypothetical protein